MATAQANSKQQSPDNTGLLTDAGHAPKSGPASDPLVMGVVFALSLTVAQRLVGFLRNVLFCHYLSDEQLGQWSLIYSIVFLLAPFAVLGLPGCFGRFVEHFQIKGQLGWFLRRINIVSAISTMVLAGVLLFFPSDVAWLIFRDSSQAPLVTILSFALIGITILNYLTSLLEAMRQIRVVTWMRFTMAILFSIISISALAIWSGGTQVVAWAFGISSFVACVPAAIFLWKNRSTFRCDGQPLGQKQMWARIAPFAIWTWLANFLHNSIEVADRYMLIHWSPVSAETAAGFVGQYHSGRVIPLVIVGVATMLGGMLMPYMTAHYERGEKDKAVSQLNWAIKLVSFAFTMISACAIVAAPLLFDTILQGRFDEGLRVLPMTLVYCTWFSIFIVAQDYMWVVEKGKYGVGLLGFGLIANIGFNALLIPRMGLDGAVIATTTANGIIVLLTFLVNWWIGCRVTLGCWLALLLPLLILLPSTLCLAAILVVTIAAIKTNLLFSDEEKDELKGLVQEKLNRKK